MYSISLKRLAYIVSIALVFAISCEKEPEVKNNGKSTVTVTITVNPEFFGYNAFIALFSGDDDAPVFNAAGYIELKEMQLNSIDLLKVIDNKLSTQTAEIDSGNYYIGVYIDMDNSTTNFTDITSWQPNAGDYQMEVQQVAISEDVTFNYYDFYKYPEPGKFSVQITHNDVMENKPLHYNIFNKQDEIISAGSITFPLNNNVFVAMEVDQSQEKVFEGGDYKLQIYCDIDNSQTNYTIGDEFYANYGDIYDKFDFRIDNDTILYINEYERIGYSSINIRLCGLDTYGGATSFLILYKKDISENVEFYGKAKYYYSIYNGCYKYAITSYEDKAPGNYFENGNYYLKSIVDLDSSLLNENNWENIVANEGDLELTDYSINLLEGDTTIDISVGNFNLVN